MFHKTKMAGGLQYGDVSLDKSFKESAIKVLSDSFSSHAMTAHSK